MSIKVGERRNFSWGSFFVEEDFEADFMFCFDDPVRPTSRVYRIVKIFRLRGKTEEFIGVSDQNHLFRMPPHIAMEKIK